MSVQYIDLNRFFCANYFSTCSMKGFYFSITYSNSVVCLMLLKMFTVGSYLLCTNWM